MGGDYGRVSFDALRDYAAVLIQQGHPILDSDWNEMVAIFERRQRAQTVDLAGRAFVPRETSHGFEIRLGPDQNLLIGRGRMYVDGLLAENRGRIEEDAAPILDRARVENGVPMGVLGELISSSADNDFIEYVVQPYLRNLSDWPPQSDGPHIIYLDVWKREVTPLKDPRLLEPALNGIDTATRWQTIWQVKVLADVGEGIDCAATTSDWGELTAPSPARLTTRTIDVESPDDPCLIPPGGGYRGLENQLYRIEIHTEGPLGEAKFKWSRDNASVGATIESFESDDLLVVRTIGRDSVLRLQEDDWVEITDDYREFKGQPGDMRRIARDEGGNKLRLNKPLSADLIPPATNGETAQSRHSRIIKWDQRGQVLLDDGTIHQDLGDSSDGLIKVPGNGAGVVLEAGIVVKFSAAVEGGKLRSQDYWNFTARTATRSVDILTDAPPAGIHHHFTRLAVVTLPDAITDCRTFWPPELGRGGGGDCGCTVCVSAEEHNTGARTLESAIAALPAQGGTICLGPGEYRLADTPIVLNEKRSVRLRGHGSGTHLTYSGPGAALRITSCQDIKVSDLAITAHYFEEVPNPEGSVALHIDHGIAVCIERCVLVASGVSGEDLGIKLSGLQLDVAICENNVSAPYSVAAKTIGIDGEQEGYCALTNVRIDRNILYGNFQGVTLEGNVLHIGPVNISDNFILSEQKGISCTGVGFSNDPDSELPMGEAGNLSPLTITGNFIQFSQRGEGVVLGLGDVRLINNHIAARSDGNGWSSGDCICLVEGLAPGVTRECQIIGNRLEKFDGTGLLLSTDFETLLIKGNIIRECGQSAISARPEALIRTLTLADNLIENVNTLPAIEDVAAVSLPTMQEACIVNNIVRQTFEIAGEGQTNGTAPVRSGVLLRGVGLLDFSHNTIVMAHAEAEGANNKIIGAFLDGVIGSADLSSNRIFGNEVTAGDTTVGWAGLVIDVRHYRGPTHSAEVEKIHAPRFPAYFRVPKESPVELYMLSTEGPRRIAPFRWEQLRVAGNMINDGHNSSDFPLVYLVSNSDKLSCTFSDNQCARFGTEGTDRIVHLEALRLVVANNIIREHSAEPGEVHIWCPTQEGPFVTVIGNCTSGPVRLNNLPLEPPFNNLNILG